VMFCSKHVDVKRHCMYFPEIKKTFAVSSLVLNLLASQTGEFFLPHPVFGTQDPQKEWRGNDYNKSSVKVTGTLQGGKRQNYIHKSEGTPGKYNLYTGVRAYNQCGNSGQKISTEACTQF